MSTAGVGQVLAALLERIQASDPSADGTEDRPDAEERYRARAATILRLVALAIEIGWPAGIGVDDMIDDGGGPDELWPVAYVELPTGQVSWHLRPFEGEWDKHDTTEKYARCAAYAATIREATT